MCARVCASVCGAWIQDTETLAAASAAGLLACAPCTAIFRKLAAISIAKLSRRCLFEVDRRRRTSAGGEEHAAAVDWVLNSESESQKNILQNVFQPVASALADCLYSSAILFAFLWHPKIQQDICIEDG